MARDARRLWPIPFLFLTSSYLFQPVLSGQADPKTKATELIKNLTGEIDEYVKTKTTPDRIFIARYSSSKTWEWKDFVSKEDALTFFKGHLNFQEAYVFYGRSGVVYVGLGGWSDSQDWHSHVAYYFDEQGRLMHLMSDFRTFVGDVKVLDSRYWGRGCSIVRRSGKSLFWM